MDIPTELSMVTVKISDANGLGFDNRVRRHDASHILRIDGLYHVWYTRFEAEDAYDLAEICLTPGRREIWLATSPDGHTWTERGSVMPVVSGAWCNCGLHAPHVVNEGERYVLFFCAHCGDDPHERHLGAAVADRPGGPFAPIGDGPLLSPRRDTGAFDSWVLDDPCVIPVRGRWHLYFKGRSRALRPCHTLIGLAQADQLTGPYVRHPDNPLVCGHTGCAWPYRDGVAMFADNPPRSIQYSDDGIHFTLCSPIVGDIEDVGICVAESDGHCETPPWGLTLLFGRARREYLGRVEFIPATEAEQDTPRQV